MSDRLAALVLWCAAAYLGGGLLVAGPFVVRGVGRVDPLARTATWGFRVIIVPGVVLFWPLLAMRWALGSVHPPTELNAHRRHAARRGPA